jgi:hypothetical protein
MDAFKKYSYLWITLMLFLITLAGHWAFAWPAYVHEQEERGQEPEFKEYFIQTMRDMLENWQSEFLQLIWQVAGLAFLWHVGSPQSKEGDERKEEKIDAILKAVDRRNAARVIKRLEAKYPKS